MKKLLFFLPILVTVACSQKPMQVAEQFNSRGVSEDSVEFNVELQDSIDLPNERVIVYFYNTGCSICIGDFCTFMRSIDDFAFDSLIVVAGNTYDLLIDLYSNENYRNDARLSELKQIVATHRFKQ